MARKVADCREFPESGCTLTISGEEDEVVAAAVDHAVSVHGDQRGPELEYQIRSSLKDEISMARPPESQGQRPRPSNLR